FRPGSSALYRGRSQDVAGFEPANRRHRNSSFEPMGHLVVRGATRLCAAATSELCKLLTYLRGRFGRKVALRGGRKCAQFAHCECNVARFVTPKRSSGWRYMPHSVHHAQIPHHVKSGTIRPQVRWVLRAGEAAPRLGSRVPPSGRRLPKKIRQVHNELRRSPEGDREAA